MSVQLSPGFKRALETELRRLSRGRATEQNYSPYGQEAKQAVSRALSAVEELVQDLDAEVADSPHLRGTAVGVALNSWRSYMNQLETLEARMGRSIATLQKADRLSR